MPVTPETIKELREQTSCGVMDCKKALEESGGNFDKAKDLLRQRGLELAAKKGSREAREGRIEAYIHQGSKIGVIVEINCETDFVANNDEFSQFSRELAMHIAASAPKYLKREDADMNVLEAQAKERETDVETLIKEACLLEQPFIKDTSKTVQDCVTDLIAKIGENIFISRFARYKVNEVE